MIKIYNGTILNELKIHKYAVNVQNQIVVAYKTKNFILMHELQYKLLMSFSARVSCQSQKFYILKANNYKTGEYTPCLDSKTKLFGIKTFVIPTMWEIKTYKHLLVSVFNPVVEEDSNLNNLLGL